MSDLDRNSMSAFDKPVDNLAPMQISEPMSRSPERKDKIVAVFFICLLLAISALCAGFPSPDPASFDETLSVDEGGIDSGNTAWVIVASGLVLFMTPGVAFFYGGAVVCKEYFDFK